MPRTIEEYRQALTLIRNVVDAVLADPLPTSQPPAPTPVPVPTPPPTGTIALSGKQLIGDDFANYASIAELTGGTKYSWKSHPELLSLAMWAGRKVLRYAQPGGSDLTPELAVSFRELSNVWLHACYALSPGWTDKGALPLNHDDSYKFLGLNLARLDGRVGYHTANGGNQQLMITATGTKGTIPATFAMLGPLGAATTDGKFYHVYIHAEQVGTDAKVALWRGPDGQAPAKLGSLTAPAGGLSASVNGVMLCQNYNKIRSAAQSVYYALWEIVDGSQHANPFGLT